jgi:hypothetical protein
MTHIDNDTKNGVRPQDHQLTLDPVMLDRRMFKDLLKMADRYIQRVRARGNISLLTESDLLVIEHAIQQMLELVEFSTEMGFTPNMKDVQ